MWSLTQDAHSNSSEDQGSRSRVNGPVAQATRRWPDQQAVVDRHDRAGEAYKPLINHQPCLNWTPG